MKLECYKRKKTVSQEDITEDFCVDCNEDMLVYCMGRNDIKGIKYIDDEDDVICTDYQGLIINSNGNILTELPSDIPEFEVWINESE